MCPLISTTTPLLIASAASSESGSAHMSPRDLTTSTPHRLWITFDSDRVQRVYSIYIGCSSASTHREPPQSHDERRTSGLCGCPPSLFLGREITPPQQGTGPRRRQCIPFWILCPSLAALTSSIQICPCGRQRSRGCIVVCDTFPRRGCPRRQSPLVALPVE